MAETVKIITVHGDRPKHTHTDPESGKEWECNSPYCTSRVAYAPGHPGFIAPVVEGHEPWRGR
jgi:hypothetical protein